MPNSPIEVLTTPRRDALGLVEIVSSAGISLSLLPSGAIFAIEHVDPKRRIMVSQVFASPIAGGMGRLFLRVGGPEPAILPVIGPEAGLRVGAASDRFVWEGERDGVGHRVTLWLHPRTSLWMWRLEVANRRESELPCDAVFIQDLGLGDQNFLMNNEAYASQYMDHHVAQHPRLNHVLMSRQNLVARRDISLGRAWLPRRRRGLCDRLSRPHGAETPRRRGISAAGLGRPCPRSAFSSRLHARPCSRKR